MGTEEQLSAELRRLRGSPTIIMGIGNTLKADDAAGPLLCDKLRNAGLSAELINAETVPENYIQQIIRKAPQNLIIIDAVDFAAAPGTARLFTPEQLSAFTFSTHAPSPRLFLDMIRKEIELDVYFIGIQPAQTRLGQPATDSVSRAIEFLADLLTEVFQIEKRATPPTAGS
jgi:hydrogenase 3 maturation protease